MLKKVLIRLMVVLALVSLVFCTVSCANTARRAVNAPDNVGVAGVDEAEDIVSDHVRKEVRRNLKKILD